MGEGAEWETENTKFYPAAFVLGTEPSIITSALEGGRETGHGKVGIRGVA